MLESESDMRVDVQQTCTSSRTTSRRHLDTAPGVRAHPTGSADAAWLCPHPGCGAVFSTKEAAVQHAKTEHFGRRRLAVATPEQDQFFRRVWPDEKMIWERGDLAKKDREKCLFNGSASNPR